MQIPQIDIAEQIFKDSKNHNLPQNCDESKKKPRQWKQSFIIASIGTPTPVLSPGINKKFKIQFHYYDTQMKKMRSHVVHFGTDTDFVFTGDKKMRLRKLTTMRNLSNPFRGNYWAAWLLNKYPTIQQGFNELQKHVLQGNTRLAQEKSTPKPAKKLVNQNIQVLKQKLKTNQPPNLNHLFLRKL